MRVWIGWSILLVAAVHTLFGIVFLGSAFAFVIRDGVFDTVRLTPPSAAGTAFWFFVSGFLAFMLGGVVHHLERLDVVFPRFLPWGLLVLTIFGCAIMPVSAWWLLFAPVAGMFMRTRVPA
jgi:uncharacterized membrane protein YagU involved in acid resistance